MYPTTDTYIQTAPLIEHQLFHKIRIRDTSALSELYDRHSKSLYTLINFILQDEDESDTILQEVFIYIWENIDSYNEDLGNYLTWIVSITRNKAIARLKNNTSRFSKNGIVWKNGSRKAFSYTPEKYVSMTPEQLQITCALQSISQEQRDLIEFSYFRGYSQSELADTFRIPLETVKINLREAMISLKDKLMH